MTPHKHHDLIVAWAKGAKIEQYITSISAWCHNESPLWRENTHYRVKPEPKPDVVLYAYIGLMGPNNASINPVNADDRKVKSDTCMFIFDGETGKLKKAEVIDEA